MRTTRTTRLLLAGAFLLGIAGALAGFVVEFAGFFGAGSGIVGISLGVAGLSRLAGRGLGAPAP